MGARGLMMIGGDIRSGGAAILNRGWFSPGNWEFTMGQVNMGVPFPKFTGNTTRLGITRNNPADWRSIRDLWDELGYSEILSTTNRGKIAIGRTPIVDAEWIAIHPEDAGLLGERIPIHHIQGLPLTIPLPASRHLDAHMPGGFRYNPGGIGSQLPIYPLPGGN